MHQSDASSKQGFVAPTEQSRPQTDPVADTTVTPAPGTPAPVTPDTRSHDDLLAEIMREHASPEQQEAALQERIERESAVLREFLAQPVTPSEEGTRGTVEHEGHKHRAHRHISRKTRQQRLHQQPTGQNQTDQPEDQPIGLHASHTPQLDANHQEQQEQPQGGNEYQQQPHQQQGEQQAPPSYTVAPTPAPAPVPTPAPIPAPKAKTTPKRGGYGVTANIQLPDRTWLRVFTGNGDPIYQWLAAERQATEQRAMELRSLVRAYAHTAHHQLDQCTQAEDGDDGRQCYVVPVEFFRFAQASAELVGVEAHLRTLGVDPSRSGITQEVWDLFHEAVVEAQTDELDEEEEGGTA